MSTGSCVERMIEDLPCAIRFPAEWVDYFEKRGRVPVAWDEQRQFPRCFLREPAALDLLQSIPALQRSTKQCRIYLKDVSRASVAFLHSEQLFPQERLLITFSDGRKLHARIARCRRIQDHCFEVGGRFVSHD